jgi:hypothetical protein
MTATRRHTHVYVFGAVIGIAVGLLVPAVSRVRGAASRMSCAGHNKQLALAWHNYHDAFEHTPAAAVPNPDLPPEQRLSWAYSLLPFIEQDALYRAVDRSQAWDSPVNATATSTPLRHLTCPALFGKPTSRLSYIGVAGVGPDAATLPADDPRIGAFGNDRTLILKEFSDGTATTLLSLETRTGGPWARGGLGTVRGLDPSDRPHHGPGRPFDAAHSDGSWWERKTHSVTAALCDGSVRTIRDSVSPEVLEALATVRGKEEVSGEW